MKERLKNPELIEDKKNTMAKSMVQFYDNKKIEILSQYNIDDDITKYIRPIYNKISKEIHDYAIKIDGRKLTLKSDSDTLEKKYERLYNILNTVKEKQNILKEQNDKVLKPVKKNKNKLKTEVKKV